MRNVAGKILILVIAVIAVLFFFKIARSFTTTKPIVVDIQENKSSNELYAEEKVKKIIKEYLISSPEVIIQAIEGLQQRKEAEEASRINEHIKNIENNSQYPILGNKDGTVSVVAFFDYNCSYCTKGNDVIEQLIQSDPSVKVVLRPLPVLGNASEHMAKIVLAVFKSNPSKFENIHKALMGMRDAITKESIENLLSKNGLDASELELLAYGEEISDLINQSMELAQNLKIRGVPAYLINEHLIPGFVDLEQLQKIIKEVKSDKP